MSPAEWFSVVQSIVLAGAALFVWLWGRDRKDVQEKIDAMKLDVAQCIPRSEVELQLRSLQKQLDQAGEKTSHLASTVNGLPERLRTMFFPMDRADDHIRESREDRQRLWSEFRRVEDRVRRAGESGRGA